MNINVKSRAATPKSRPFCFLCNNRTALSAHNAIKIFDTISDAEGITLADILASVLERPITDGDVHSYVMCKKCQGICSEYQDAMACLNNIKENIITTYNATATKLNITVEPAECQSTHVGVYAVAIDDDATQLGHSDGHVIEADIVDRVGDDVLATQKPSELIVYKNDGKCRRKQETKNLYINDMILEDVEGMEYGSQESHETIIISNSVIEGSEYFEDGEDHMIEINADDVDRVEDYETFVFEEDVNSVESQDDDECKEVMANLTGNEMLQVGPDGHRTMNVMDGYEIKVENSDADGDSSGQQQTATMFQRDGMNFKCQMCNNDVIYDAKSIAIHMKTDHFERIYVCDICGADFRKRNLYNDHMDDHTLEGKDGEYQCGVCESVFSNARQLRAHKKTHSMCVKIWSCKECNKSYSSKNLLDEHMNMHTGERPYKCPHCTKDFASKYTLTAHMKTHYERKRPYECKECNKSFFSNQNLTQHERTHSGIKEYVCEICNKAFGTPHNLDVHKIVHTGHKPFICRTCGKAFARRAEIKDHERTHTGERPYQCDICTASFAQRSNLMSHKRATHFDDKRYKCDTCDRSFKRRRLLEYHIRASHTGERPYRCDICGSTFVYPEHYKKHVRIHSGVKPFTCEVCGKAFNSRDNRNAHRFVHSDKKPYECLVCGMGFMRKPLLYAHMQAQNHVNDTIVINQPRIGEKVSDQLNEVVYLNMNSDEMMDEEDGFNPFEEEHIIEEGEIMNEEEHSIIDDPAQFNTNGQNTQLTADGDSLYIDEAFQDSNAAASSSTKRIAGNEDSSQYKYVFLDRIGNEIMPLESV